MMFTLILPWFPIILSAAVGARLVGPSRATWLGVTCAIYWVVVVQVTSQVPFWADLSTLATLIAGSAAIVGMAEWSGRKGEIGATVAVSEVSAELQRGAIDSGVNAAVAAALTEFDDWLEAHRLSADPWPEFDEFVRGLLYRHCRATHVRPFRMLGEQDAMLPLRAAAVRATGTDDGSELVSARQGILGHVASTGRSYRAGQASQGELVESLARASSPAVEWCFAVRRGARTLGVVAVGQLGEPRCVGGNRPSDGFGHHRPQPHGLLTRPPAAGAPDQLRIFEQLVSQFWITLKAESQGRSAATIDPVSQMLVRESFLEQAQRATAESFAHGEPVALAVIAIEGLRTLLDEGRWDLANDVVQEVARTLKMRIRPDDLLGRFDETRFLLLLRRVDSALASLIATNLTDRLCKLSIVGTLRDRNIGLRCGIAGSPPRQSAPPVAQLTAHAVRLCHRAREQEMLVASDVHTDPESVEMRT